ncbi:Cytochrome oxidase assembly protein ShyY1 [Neptunomonas antarctica]|uniref:SURF1-like protein n=1 Tax=Neptunomonas antarctica TaxID=619304 RepID=A0A1N7J238_9GAMM|nr:Cytochrome oxidase assembly protein ShyY1 [Neptunomonas antarctica]
MQALIICSLLVGLGNWQLQRANEKEQLLMKFSNAQTKQSISDDQIHRFDKIELSGTLMTHRFFLLDNRTWQGKVGYELIAALQPDSGKSLQLVSLGWLAATSDRNQLPSIVIPDNQFNFTAYADHPSQPLLLTADRWAEGWPKRIQQVDLKKIAVALNTPASAWLFRPVSPPLQELTLTWKPVVLPPERHIGYAVQWFGLAVAWLICSMVLAWKMFINKEATS